MNSSSANINKITSLLQEMFKIQQHVDSLLLRQVGIGLSSYRILSILDSRTALTQRKISGLLGQSEANISRQIRHMADDGLVKIAPDKKDKRQRNISRTSKGDKKLTNAQKHLVSNSNYFLKNNII
jgi:DNA-binding MarR family transcriptional regulator